MGTTQAAESAARSEPSRGRPGVVRRLLAHRAGLLGIVLVALLAVMAAAAPWLATEDPAAQDLSRALQPPSRQHWLGTDELGRDIYSRIVHGSRLSMTLSVLTVAVAATVGTLIGITAGYFGGWFDEVIMRLTDIILAFPGVLLAVTIVAVLGSSMINVLIAVGIYITPGFVRVSRGTALAVKQNEYVTAARSVGVRDGGILLRHILPNCLSPIIVQSTLRVGSVILLAAGLSFLGLGPKPPTPEWGLMLSTGRDFLRVAPHVSVIPGAAIMLAVLGFNLLGDALRDVLDPQN